MNASHNFEPDPLDGNLGRRLRGYFSRIGLALALMMVVYIGIQLLAATLIARLAPDFMQTNWYYWLLSVVPLYCFGVPTFALVIHRVPRVETEQRRLKAGEFFTSLIICFGIMYVGSYIGNYLMALLAPEATNALSERLVASDPLINLCVTVLLAPIVEELIFRRAIIDRARPYGEGLAIVFSALMFGLFHGNLFQFFYAFGVGLMLGFVYVRTGRLRYTIVMHAVINLFGGVIAPYILSNIDADELALLTERAAGMSGSFDAALIEGISQTTLVWLMLYGLFSMVFMGLAIAGVVLLFVRRRRFHLERAEFPIPRDRVGGIVYFNPGVIAAVLLCVVLMVMNM